MIQQVTPQDFKREFGGYSIAANERTVSIRKYDTGWVCWMRAQGFRNSCRYTTLKAAKQSAMEFVSR